jgi:hypothetical protein
MLLDFELLCSWTLSTVAYINKEHKIAQNGCLHRHVKGWGGKNWLWKTQQLSHQSFIYIRYVFALQVINTMDEDTNTNPLNPPVHTYNTLELISHHTVNNSYKLQ